ncbi:MAG: PQQ-binding-like beta-propeller repeat protein [Planctomycetales bacterium]
MLCRIKLTHAFFLILVSLLVPVANARTWNTKTGTHQVEAEFVEYKSGKVKLKKDNGKFVTVPMDILSDDDQDWVRAELKRQKKAKNSGSQDKNKKAAGQPNSSNQWHQWRGPNRDGKATDSDLLSDWDDREPPLLWTANGLGSGHSSVAISDGKIFTMGIVAGGCHLIALDAADGSQLWTAPVGGGDNVSCTPTVDGDLVYGLSFDGDLVCARVENGEEVWRKSFTEDFRGQMMSQWGYAESPLVDGDRLICTPGGNGGVMVALDKRTGKGIWSTPFPDEIRTGGKEGAGYSSIVVSEGGGRRQYIQLVGRGLIGVATDNGQLLWTYGKIANDTANIPTPVVQGDYVFCSTGYQTGAALLRLKRKGKGVTANEVYFLPHNILQNHHGGMIMIGDHIYCGHGHNKGLPVCIEWRTGDDAWRLPGRGPGGGSAAVSYADGHLYFRYEDGVMALIEATPDEYRLKGSFRIASRHGKSWPHPVIADGRLYLRDQHELHCYDLRQK